MISARARAKVPRTIVIERLADRDRGFLSRIRGALRYLRLRPFDGSTPEGRAEERQRRALLASVAALFAKVIAVSTQLISVPLTLGYLGTERFGMWATMSSMIAMLAFADLGIGNGLLNAISEANGRNDLVATRRYIASAAVMLCSVGLVLLVLFGVSYPAINWGGVFNVKTPLANAEAGPAAAMFVFCFALNIPATIVQRTQLALQMGYLANLWQAVGSALALVAVLGVIHFHGGLHWLVLGFAGTPVFAAVVNGLWFFLKKQRELLPDRSSVSRASGALLLRSGTMFLILQIVVSVTYMSDAVIISRLLGANSVTGYAVPEKLFSVIPMILTIMMLPLWPAYVEAVTRRDFSWVRLVLKSTLIIAAAIALPASVGLFFGAPEILRVWTNNTVQASPLLLFGFAVWKVVEALGSTTAVYLNGNNLIKEQVLMAVFTAIAAVLLKIQMINSLGIAGAIWATIISYLLFTVPPTCFLLLRSLKASRNLNAESHS